MHVQWHGLQRVGRAVEVGLQRPGGRLQVRMVGLQRHGQRTGVVGLAVEPQAGQAGGSGGSRHGAQRAGDAGLGLQVGVDRHGVSRDSQSLKTA